ncbi:RusA family crossover junction endodeoxyribonuclease [Achromobacter sp. NFACC18-2]|uniref:RusA family crossover junction endodeoxyribonuclease n=1 Tax=Achromobacter sp. NFACC18-2 TaxID=1564112 RepID=UPI000B85120A|nr:RusA family crossover junction endodeoxyribonuclease [Achromobacter sp. NFACC18-2]
MTTTTSNHTLVVVPKPAPRPRAATIRGHAVMYDPADYKAHKLALKSLLPTLDAPALTGELRMDIEFVCEPIKKSKFTTPKGDLDNLAKPLMDVLTQEGWYGDDRQITALHLTKRFPAPGEDPHINFKLTELT